MKFLKTAVVILSTLFLLAACQPAQETQTPEMEDNAHLGCASNEINQSGTCKPPSFENADMFHVDNLEEKITSENINNENFRGYHTRPNDNGTYPGVIMIHEWWGLNEGIKYMADILASHGYAVFAIDLYNGSVAETSSRAGQLSGQVRNNLRPHVQQMKDATEWLRSQSYVDEDNMASIGWCFGGGMSLELALSGEQFAGTVIYYGSLTDNETELEKINWPVLGIFASEDNVISPDSVTAFNQTLEELEIEKDIHMYEGVGHAFANPSGEGFAPNETRDAWSKTLAFFEENLK